MMPRLLADNDKCIQAEEMRTRECASAPQLSVVGDTPVQVQLRAWDELHNVVMKVVQCNGLELNRIDTGCTRLGSAYNHDKGDPSMASATNHWKTMAQWHLDHILFTPSTLIPLG